MLEFLSSIPMYIYIIIGLIIIFALWYILSPPLYEQKWFINLINWLRVHSSWFEKYGWGKSLNMEDFVRNPFEVMRDECIPFAFHNVKPFSLLMRIRYIPYKLELEQAYLDEIKSDIPNIEEIKNAQGEPNTGMRFCLYTYKQHYAGKSYGFNIGKYRMLDLICSNWITKYPSATFMLQFLISMKYKIIPIPFISMNIRFKKTRYFQFGFGWAPQWRNYDGSHPGDDSITAALSAKFRVGDYLKELEWNPNSEVYGYWEGTA